MALDQGADLHVTSGWPGNVEIIRRVCLAEYLLSTTRCHLQGNHARPSPRISMRTRGPWGCAILAIRRWLFEIKTHQFAKSVLQGGVTPTLILANSKRDSLHQVGAKTMLETLEYFTTPVAHDLIQPDVAIHIDKERSLGEPNRLRVFHNCRVH
jgi:hypothetical protein